MIPLEAKYFPHSSIHSMDHCAEVFAMAISSTCRPSRRAKLQSSNLLVSMAVVTG